MEADRHKLRQSAAGQFGEHIGGPLASGLAFLGILENRLQGAGFENHSSQKGPIYATDDEHIYWPFTGEYWRDELGYYLYTIKSECGR